MVKHDLLLLWVLLVVCGLVSSGASGARDRFPSTGEGETMKKEENINVVPLTEKQICDNDSCGERKQGENKDCDNFKICDCYPFEDGKLPYCMPHKVVKNGLKRSSTSDAGSDVVILPDYIGQSSDDDHDHDDSINSGSSNDQYSSDESNNSGDNMDTSSSLGDDSQTDQFQDDSWMHTDNEFLQNLLDYPEQSDSSSDTQALEVQDNTDYNSATHTSLTTDGEQIDQLQDDMSYYSAVDSIRSDLLSDYVETPMQRTVSDRMDTIREDPASSDEDTDHSFQEELSNISSETSSDNEEESSSNELDISSHQADT